MFSENSKDKNIIKSVAWVSEVLKESKLKLEILHLAETEISELSAFLNCSYHQTILMVAFFHLKMEGSLPSVKNVLKYLGLNIFGACKIKNDLKELVALGLIRVSAQPGPCSRLEWTYAPPECIMDKLICGTIGTNSK